ncbi:CLUMA_CG003297, isoform A [Clunio marinus]|uniref:CLUMA_CG003297, isoform A n=1 Tax=Clunio marinus TaxID=568069 RepID=A0A1J1HQF2_9DIPT|nr:CLUMA_CG003297, isoform A [Clunio marinus]
MNFCICEGNIPDLILKLPHKLKNINFRKGRQSFCPYGLTYECIKNDLSKSQIKGRSIIDVSYFKISGATTMTSLILNIQKWESIINDISNLQKLEYIINYVSNLNAGKRKSAFDELQKKCENKLVDILLLQEPALHKGKTLFLLNLSRNDLRVMMGVLTGHCCLYKHLNSMQRTQLINCRYCKGMTEETMQHVVASCDAHSRVRLRVFNHTVINAEELAEVEPEDLLLFMRRTGVRDQQNEQKPYVLIIIDESIVGLDVSSIYNHKADEYFYHHTPGLLTGSTQLTFFSGSPAQLSSPFFSAHPAHLSGYLSAVSLAHLDISASCHFPRGFPQGDSRGNFFRIPITHVIIDQSLIKMPQENF